jgi:serine palmitoyltransferase
VHARERRPTGKTRRCLNLGSYNYLGFGGVNSYCTPLVEEAVRDLPLTTASSDAELGHTQVRVQIAT